MIIFESVSKDFRGERPAVSELSLEVKEGEVLVLLGRSGSGKTTALRLMNRLIDPTSGKIFFNGKDLSTLDPIQLRRSVGYAIQHIGLFLHMTVEENIGIVPKLLGWDPKKIQARVKELLEMMGLSPKEFCDLYPTKLSGGQKQRVGVARALAANPPVILMDEPFGALDPIMREQLQNEFLQIQSKIKKTIVFVTHDVTEAVKMGDRIAVLDKGKLLQIGSVEELIHQPASDFIDQFLGKDRFQLILHTKSVGHLVADLLPPEPSDTTLSLNSSLMEAFLAFKMHETKTISVVEGDKAVGNLSRQQLVETMLRIL